MNFGQAILILFAFSNSADGQAGDQSPKLRGLATTRDKNSFHVGTYDEKLGSCTGTFFYKLFMCVQYSVNQCYWNIRYLTKTL